MTVGALIRTDPPPREVLQLQWNPDQYLRQLGVGGWVEREHPRAKSSTEWVGTPLHEVRLDITLVAARQTRPTHRGVEDDRALLNRWGLPVVAGDPASEPPRLQVAYGYGQQLRWVIRDLVWGRIDFDATGLAQTLTVAVELLEHRSATLLLSPVEQAQGQAATPAAAGARTHTVAAGDTLSRVAAAQLGAAGRWPEIADLNGLRDPDALTVGQVLTLPAA